MPRRTMIIVGVALLLIGGVTVYFLTSNTTQAPQDDQSDEDIVIESLEPEEIGLSVSARPDKKAVRFTIDKASDITHVEYQIAYIKQVSGEEIPEGLIGEVSNATGASRISIDYRELGTCSANVCRYDIVVSDITFILKVTKKDGKIYQVEETLSL